MNKTQLSRIDRVEWLFVRAVFALLLAWRPDISWQLDSPKLVGWARFVDFSILVRSPDALFVFDGIRYVALFLYVCGLWLLPVTGVLLVQGAIVFSLFDSQGAIEYVGQMHHLLLLGQFLALAQTLFMERRLLRTQPEIQAVVFKRFISYSQMALLLIYAISAITKLRVSGLNWIMTAPNIALQVAKSFHMEHYNSLDPELFTRGWNYAEVPLLYPNLMRILFGTGLALELFGVFALTSRRATALIGFVLIVFHQAISNFMHVNFLTCQIMAFLFLLRFPRCIAWLGHCLFSLGAKEASARRALAASPGVAQVYEVVAMNQKRPT